jgi:hypothetical protein
MVKMAEELIEILNQPENVQTGQGLLRLSSPMHMEYLRRLVSKSAQVIKDFVKKRPKEEQK